MTTHEELTAQMNEDLWRANNRFILFKDNLERALANKNPLLLDYARDNLSGLSSYDDVTAENAEEIQKVIKDAGDKRNEHLKTILTNFNHTEHEVELHDIIGDAVLVLSSLRFFLRGRKKLASL